MGSHTHKKAMMQKFIFLISLLFFVIPGNAIADEAKTQSASIGIYHNPQYSGQSLPSAGAPLQLKAQLYNTNDVSIQLRTFATIDGRLIELTPSKVYLNRDDYPEYVIETNSPRVSLSYYFVAYSRDGRVIRSDNFTLQRPCVPSIEPVSAEVPNEIKNGQQRLIEMVHRNWSIEEELKAYEHAQVLIKAIQSEMERLDGKK